MSSPVTEYYQPQPSPLATIWRETIGFYANHFSAVVKVLLPPTVIAYFGALFFQYQIEIVRANQINGVSVLMSHGFWAYERILLPIQAMMILKQWFIWVCYCFALIGICNLVSEVMENGRHSGTSVFSPIRERPLRFLGSATLFFGVLVLGYLAMSVLSIGTYRLLSAGHINVPMPWGTWIVAFVDIALVSAVIVRWAFAVPLTVLHGLAFGSSMKASDRMTDYRMFALWRLVMESEIAGYFALIVPSYLLFYLRVPPTPFTYYAKEAAAILLSAMTQAPLMVGIGVVLAKRETQTSAAVV